jgi:hypothetical protein
MPARRSCGPTARATWIGTAILVLLFLGPRQAPAHSFIPKTFDDLVAEADHIFQGAVTGKQSRTLQSGIIVTDVAFSIILELKGHAADPVTLVVLGGTVGEERVDVAGFPELAVGREYLLFVKDNGTTILPFVGGDQGLSLCQTNPANGRCINPVVPAASATVQINANQTPTFAVFVRGTGNVSFDPGVNRAFVRFRTASGATVGATSVAVRTQ